MKLWLFKKCMSFKMHLRFNDCYEMHGVVFYEERHYSNAIMDLGVRGCTGDLFCTPSFSINNELL